MHIIGGGVIGLCCAWYLREAGYEVTVIDQTDLTDGCSYGNAGIIVPSHSVPLAAPGMTGRGLWWMLRPKSPFFIQPRFNPALWRWLWQFYQSCTTAHVESATPALCRFHLLSKSLYAQFAGLPDFSFAFEQRGSLMLYRTERARREELENAERAAALGLRVAELSQSEVQAVYGDMQTNILGGIFYEDDAHIYPGKFLVNLREYLHAAGVRFLTGHQVIGFDTSGSRITTLRIADGPPVPVNHVILASGAWTGKLADKLGLRLLMQDGKGYSITLSGFSPRPSIPSILTEARVAVTPMGDDLRIAGTLEVSHFNPKVNDKRVLAMLHAMTQYYPEFPMLDLDQLHVWHGFRPVTPDGLPYIGRVRAYENLVIAAGHAMLGMSLGPATGLLVSEIVQGKPTLLPLDIFHPDRFN